MSAFIFAQHYTGYELFYVCRRGLAEVCKYFDIITASKGQRVRCLFICLFFSLQPVYKGWAHQFHKIFIP